MTDPTPDESFEPGHFTKGLYVLEDAAAYSITAAKIEPPTQLTINRPDGQPLVTIHTSDGRLEYGPGYEPDEAARLFWEAMQREAATAYFGPHLHAQINEHLAAGQAAQERVKLLTDGVTQRSALLEECRDILEQAGQNGAHGDDWPRIAPAVRAMAAELATARLRVLELEAQLGQGTEQ